MAGLETPGSNPDVSMLYDINALARSAPGWLDGTVRFLGEYGLLIGMVVLLLACWWTERRRAESLAAAASSAAAVIWAPLAAALAVLVNVPIRGFVGRPRPFADHEGLDVLVHSRTEYSFVSDHATLAMAIAAGLFVTSRKFGLAGIALAFAEGFCRIYVGVQYPTDVVGGFALGTAVVLLLSPLATLALTPLMKAVATSVRVGWLIWPRPVAPAEAEKSPGLGQADLSGQDLHEGLLEQCSEPARYREPQLPVPADSQERRGRRVRQSRAARDRDEAGQRDRRETVEVSEPSSGPRHPAQPGGLDPQEPREPDLAA